MIGCYHVITEANLTARWRKCI